MKSQKTTNPSRQGTSEQGVRKHGTDVDHGKRMVNPVSPELSGDIGPRKTHEYPGADARRTGIESEEHASRQEHGYPQGKKRSGEDEPRQSESHTREEHRMNKEHLSGGLKEAKGVIEENLGHVTGNEAMATEGVIDQVAGKIQQAFGDIKDRVKDAVDKVLEKKPATTDSDSRHSA